MIPFTYYEARTDGAGLTRLRDTETQTLELIASERIHLVDAIDEPPC